MFSLTEFDDDAWFFVSRAIELLEDLTPNQGVILDDAGFLKAFEQGASSKAVPNALGYVINVWSLTMLYWSASILGLSHILRPREEAEHLSLDRSRHRGLCPLTS